MGLEAEELPDPLAGVAGRAVALALRACTRAVLGHDLVCRHGPVQGMHGDALGLAAVAQLIDARATVFDGDVFDALVLTWRRRVVADQGGRGLRPCAGRGDKAKTGEQECAHGAIVGGGDGPAAAGTMPR